MFVPGAASVQVIVIAPFFLPFDESYTTIHVDELIVPFVPVPFVAPEVVHEILLAAIAVRPDVGGVKFATSAFTEMRRCFPLLKLPVVDQVMVVVVDPAVFCCARVTMKASAPGMLMVMFCANAGTALASSSATTATPMR